MTLVRVAGHFGELLQGTAGRNGPLALLTLPCPALAVTARLTGPGQALQGPLPAGMAHDLLARLGLPWPGAIAIEAAMPVGGGAGSSTAALVAVARLAGWQGEPGALARACVAVEGASDPLMMPQPGRLLWASRQGHALDVLPPLMRCEIVGAFFGPPQATREAAGFADIADLLADWRQAGTLRRQAALASASAARRRGANAAATLARDLGALGWVAAHTGSARGLIFPAGGIPRHARAALIEAGGHAVVAFPAGE